MSGGLFDPLRREEEAARLERAMASPDFWHQPQRARQLTKQLGVLRGPLDEFLRIEQAAADWRELWALARAESEEALHKGLWEDGQSLLDELRGLELTLILRGPYDGEDAIVTLHAGAGGTEAQDWVEMLLRMYLRWAERKKFSARILDQLPGEEAGLKSVSVEIQGTNAFGFLRAERGIHRLVRISPFDASGRRHTSFASLEVIPDLEMDDAIVIRPEDLRVDTFRASGAGGQHINKTDSAVRITHLPTDTVVSCQSERSQHANRETAMRLLRGKLAEIREREWEAKMAEVRGVQLDIGWGSQIRSYVFQPYTSVRDHRTRYQVSNVTAVMDGELDGFIEAFLQAEARGTLALETEVP